MIVLSALLALTAFSCSVSENIGDLNGQAVVNSASNPYVQLDFAVSSRTWVSGYDNVMHADGNILVENVAYNKQVVVHWLSKNGTWKDTPATYVKSIANNQEVWSFTGIGDQVYQPYFGGSASIKFAIRYTVNGITKWDNNGGSDYLVYQGGAGQNPSSYPATFKLGAAKVKVLSSSFSTQSGVNKLYLSLGVKNLAYNKTVGIKYTTDNWKTSATANATYQQGSNGQEETWVMNLDVPAAKTNIKFAAFLTVNGTSYWDNNYSANYSLNVQ